MLRSWFTDRHGEVRIHWRIALAVLLFITCITGALLACAAAGWATPSGIGAAALAGATAATWLLTRFVNHKPLSAVGIGLSRGSLADLLRGAGVGMSAIGALTLVLWISGHAAFAWYDRSASDTVAVTAYALVTIGVSAAAEELVFRGYLFQTFVQGVTLLPATLLMSAVFALAHRWNPAFTVISGVNIGLAGLVFCIAYAKTGRLWLPLGIHWGWNFSQQTLAGFPASGLVDPDRMLCTATITGPAWWTGGPFGPEGGLVATVVLLGCSWFILKAGQFRRSPGLVTLDSIEDLLPKN